MTEATVKYLLGLQRKKFSEGKKMHINTEISIIFFRMHGRYVCDICNSHDSSYLASGSGCNPLQLD